MKLIAYLQEIDVYKKLTEDNGISLLLAGRNVPFDSISFKILLKRDNLYTDSKFSKRAIDNRHQIQYLHSSALIEYVTKKLELNAKTIMNDLK